MSRSGLAVDNITPSRPADGADRSAFVGRLHLILAHWPSADRLARAMGVSPSAFRKWLKGEAEPSRERLVALARAAGVGIAWLAEGEGPDPAFAAPAGTKNPTGGGQQQPDPDWAQFAVMPANPVAVPAGANPLPPRFVALHHAWIRAVCGVEPENLALEHATDDSMRPTIKRHDTILIDTAHGGFQAMAIYVLEVDGQRLIRRVQRLHGGDLVLISDNAACQPDRVARHDADRMAVIGRVVWVGGTV